MQTSTHNDVITDVLRGRLGYQGVVVSDDFCHAAAVHGRSPAERAVDFVRAGGDLILTVATSDAAPMSAALMTAAADPAFAARIDDAVLHVLVGNKTPACSPVAERSEATRILARTASDAGTNPPRWWGTFAVDGARMPASRWLPDERTP